MPTLQELLDAHDEIPEFMQPYGPQGRQGTNELAGIIPQVRAAQDRQKFNELLDKQRGLSEQQLAYQEAHPPQPQGKFSRWLEATFQPAARYGQLQRRDEARPLQHMAAEQNTVGNLLDLYQPAKPPETERGQVVYPGAMLLGGQTGRFMGYNPPAEKPMEPLQQINPKMGYLDRQSGGYLPPQEQDPYVEGIGAEIADDFIRSGVNIYRPGTKAWGLANEAIANKGTAKGDEITKWLRNTYIRFFHDAYQGKTQYGQTPTPEALNTIKENAAAAMEKAMEGIGGVQEPGTTAPTPDQWIPGYLQQHPEAAGLPEEELFRIYQQEVEGQQ